MRRLSQLVVGTVLVGVATAAHAAEPRERSSTDGAARNAGHSTSVHSGQLAGIVTDSAGVPPRGDAHFGVGPRRYRRGRV